jgi:putative holliday junction resolvase
VNELNTHRHPRLILAFDFGTRRIGVASGDTLTRTARALTTLDAAASWPSIDALVREYTPSQFVVGLPLNMDGSPTVHTDAARAFADQLRVRYSAPVTLVDERLSSKEAEAQLREARASGLKKRRTVHADIDAVAARILLEQWLRQVQKEEPADSNGPAF